jgi:hypothetical protein
LGSLAQVIDSRLADTLKLGIRRENIDAMESDIESANLDPERRRVIEGELEVNRERQDALRRQIDKLRGLLEESQKNIGLSKDHFRSAISCALEMIGAESLATVKQADASGPERAVFPALDQREGADPSWAETMDTLRAPKPRDQKYWEWRRSSPIRSVVFEDTGTMDDDVVHLHLEHRVVQRLLGRFVAQGFVHHDLSRACFAQTSDAIPRVILLGRLGLYGPGAARLHEELIPVTARWTDAKIRKNPLAPYARDAESKTMALLEEALIDTVGRSVSEVTLKQLQAVAPQDIQELLPHLTARGEEYAEDATKKLQERANAEAKAMREILETQKKHLENMVSKHDKVDPKQMLLDFQNEEERRQQEADRRHWGKRLEMLEQELRTEPERIRELYQVKAKRIEPVGLVYLWPITG